MNFNAKTIPALIRNKNQWVAYKTYVHSGHTMKVMISPVTGICAKSNASETWCSFFNARMYMLKHKLDGLAFVLTEGITFIDIDHTLNEDGSLSNFAKEILNEFPRTYAEYSCSGKGVHILCQGKLPFHALKRNDQLGLEMYDTKRFVCITGNLINNRKEILNYAEQVPRVNEKYMGKVMELKHVNTYAITQSDDEIIKRILKSKNKEKFTLLYSGDITGYPSQSNADFALVKILSFWTQNPEQIDGLFRSSGLYREKWDRQLGDSTYGRVTIDNALRNTIRVFDKNEPEM